MPKTIVFANQKGGVTKTTTAASFAAELVRRGYRVLVVDADPQANLSDSVGADTQDSNGLYDLLKRDATAEDCIQELGVFDLIASSILLAGAEQEFTQTGKEFRLREELETVAGRYEYIVIDTPPSLGILTVNAFTAADSIIVPTTPGIFSASGIQQLNTTVQNIQKYCNPKVKIVGILLTKYNPQINISRDMQQLTSLLSDHINAPLFHTHIRSSVAVEEAQAKKVDIFRHKAYSTVARDYSAFVDEFLAQEAAQV